VTTEVLMRGIERLTIRFGARSFDPETVSLIYREVNAMSEAAFNRLVDVLIGSRKATNPPLIQDFRDARIAEQNKMFQDDVHGAARAMNSGPRQQGLQKFLKERFGGGVTTLNQAIEIRRMQIQARKATDPSYDPLTDPEWQ